MGKRKVTPDRIHLIAHGSPLLPDLARFGFEIAEEYAGFAQEHLPDGLRLTYDLDLLRVEEQPWNAGRQDDARRVKDLQGALQDARTLAIVAASGGAYFARILPDLKFDVLTKRTEPIWAVGFSEMSTLVNYVASYRCGRGLYWLCPNWMGYRLQPPEAARAALGEYWRVLPDVIAGRLPQDGRHLAFGPVEGQVVSGRPTSGSVRLVGGCLAVMAAAVGGPLGKRARPDNKWLFLEDIKESPYRCDRHLAALKMAGWFEKVAGVLVGDFHMMHTDTQSAVLELLKYHLPKRRKVPVVTSRSFGHVWPLVPILVNQPVRMEVRRGGVTLHASGLKEGRD